MRVFLDTEFTDLRQPRLMSIGLVAEDGCAFYCELLDGWLPGQCTPFVLDTVLPLFEGPAVALPRETAGARLAAWLASLGRECLVVVCDAQTDWLLMKALVEPHEGSPRLSGELLSWPGQAMARRHDDLIKELLGAHPRRHHALVDAQALRQAVMQTEADFLVGR